MIIDVMITFNDMERGDYISSGSVGTKGIEDFYTQLILCIKSINKINSTSTNEYKIYVLHSKHLDEYKKQKLSDLGANIIFDNENFLEDRITNRVTAYKNNMGGDYSLILDTDTIFINDPVFDFSKDIMMKPFSYSTISKSKFIEIYRMCGVDNIKENLKLNNGVVFIKNDIKEEVYNKCYELKEILFTEENFSKIPTFKHFIEEVMMSIIFNTFENRGFFDDKINSTKLNDNTSIYHYTGGANKNIIKGYLKKYNN